MITNNRRVEPGQPASLRCFYTCSAHVDVRHSRSLKFRLIIELISDQDGAFNRTVHVPAAMASNDLRFRSRRILLRHRISRDPTIALLLWSDGSTVTAPDKRRPAVNTGTFSMTRGESVGSAAPRIQSTRNPIGWYSSPAFLSISNAACLRMSLARLRLCLRPDPPGATAITLDSLPHCTSPRWSLRGFI